MMAITNLTCQTSLTIDAHEPLKLHLFSTGFPFRTRHRTPVCL